MKPIRFSVAGAGGFAFFAVSEFSKAPQAKFVGVFDEVKENAARFTSIAPDIAIYSSLDDLCSDSEVDLVYIATPPSLHYEQSKRALLSGKHVICEKPAAIKLAHAQELRDIAKERNLLFVVNLMQRYNFLFDAVRKIIDQGVLGKFLHGFFENYASDEFLKEDHWFWNEEKSGGIFIEHCVHFFDLFGGWLGKGTVVAAQKLQRPGYPNLWDRVQATVLYAGGLVNFYHGFDQPKVMDRQEMRLQFEKGDLTLYEWVPTRMKINALCDEQELYFLRQLFSTASVSQITQEPKKVRGRFKDIGYRHIVQIDTGDTVQKQTLYQELVGKMFDDQLAWIVDRNHIRKITDENAVSSLQIAEAAEKIAQRIS